MKILWVDDDWIDNSQELEELYNDLQNEIEKHLNDVEIERTHDSSAAYKLIDRNDYVFAIIDIEYLDVSKKKQITVAQELFDKLENRRIHYAVYSNYIRDIQIKSHFCVGLYSKGKDRQLEFVEDIIKYITNPSYRIIQMNDLHYSAQTDTNDSDEFFKILQEYLKEIDNTKKIDLAMFAGDFSDKNPSEELFFISDWIKKTFFENLKIKHDRIFIVPGNHEVIWSNYIDQKRSNRPYSAYVNFLQSIYNNKRDILSSFVSWVKSSMPIEAKEEGLSWHRSLLFPNISVIGICSNSSSSEEQGMGVLSQENIRYIKEKWKSEKSINETRILILHHNLFPVRSNDNRDEDRTILNAGKALNTLVESKCDIILSGHTHRSESVLYKSTVLTSLGYETGKEILLISSGTCGGIAPTYDLQKSFNVIDISLDTDNKRRVEVTPHLYDSRTSTWEGKTSAVFYV